MAWKFKSKLLSLILTLILTYAIEASNNGGFDHLYPYGTEEGDAIAPVNDDGSTGEIHIGIPFPFFHQPYSSIWVNTNGVISFLNEVRQYVPDPFPQLGPLLIAPFWDDIDTRINSGRIFYREDQSQELLQLASSHIRQAFVEQTHFQATWLFIATWNNVTYFTGNQSSNISTFQAVMVTNGRHSFVIYNYGNLTWTRNNAQAGFNAGDGVRYFSIPGSHTPDVINIDQTSNVGLPGRWVFRVDEAEVIGGGCNAGGSLAVGPRFVTPFGGKRVTISGPCFNQSTSLDLYCRFSGHQVPAYLIDETRASCVVPITYQFGKQELEFSIDGGRNFSFKGVIWYVENEDADYQLRQDVSRFWFMRGLYRPLRLSWNRDIVMSSTVSVDFVTFKKDENSNEIAKHVVRLAENVPNSGRYQLPDRLEMEPDLIYATTGVIRITEEGLPLAQTQSLYTKYGPALWYFDRFIYETALRGEERFSNDRGIFDDITGVYETISRFVDFRVNNLKAAVNQQLLYIGDALLRPQCDEWHEQEMRSPPDYDSVLEAPCNLNQALRDPRFVADHECSFGGEQCEFFNRGAYHCVRSAEPSTSGSGQHACYDELTNLLAFENGGGTFDKVYPNGPDSTGRWRRFDHYAEDVLPYIGCCKLSLGRCHKYNEVRPTHDCDNYEESRPGGGNGDPHIITLDGLSYTFNGVGEFDILRINTRNLTVQGRTEAISGFNSNGSVWTALALRTTTSSVIQVQTYNLFGMEVLVDGEVVSFEDMPMQRYEGVTVTYINDRVIVQFEGLAIIEVQEVDGSLDFLTILSPQARGITRGLLGVWNGNPDDDLMRPDGETLPSNSNESTIFKEFGLLWRITEESSLFVYPPGKSYESFQDLDFVPTFGLPEADEEKLERAEAICGDDTQCQFDYLVTGNEKIANRTSQAQQEIRDIVEDVKPVVTCGFPEVPPGGTGNITNGPVGALIVFDCIEGYTFSGSKTRMCQEDGSWSGQTATCTEIQCGSLDEPANGFGSTEGGSIGSTVSFGCDRGFSLGGSGIRVCQLNGTWSGETTTCNDDASAEKISSTYSLTFFIILGLHKVFDI